MRRLDEWRCRLDQNDIVEPFSVMRLGCFHRMEDDIDILCKILRKRGRPAKRHVYADLTSDVRDFIIFGRKYDAIEVACESGMATPSDQWMPGQRADVFPW